MNRSTHGAVRQESSERATPRAFTFTVQTREYRSMPLPGIEDAKLGTSHVCVKELPEELDRFMAVNPRVPKRSQKGVLSGPVIKGILTTLREQPEDMVLKNQGLYLLVEDARFERGRGGEGTLTITLSNPRKHGIVNGGHTYAAIRDAIENASDDEEAILARAFVRLHLMEGIKESRVPEIAEGLNRSKQVDDPSLMHLRGLFEDIKKVMKGHPGEEAIAYHQGDDGDVYISEILVFLQMFNQSRYDGRTHPYQLYRSQSKARDFFTKDMQKSPSPIMPLIAALPEILELADRIRQAVPESAKRIGFEFGRMKGERKERAGSKKHRNTPLPFIGESMNHRVPNGWLFPMLAGFRANVEQAPGESEFRWIVPLEQLLPDVIEDLVSVCVSEHRDNGMRPELVGKRESAYRQCYDKIMINLATRGKLGKRVTEATLDD